MPIPESQFETWSHQGSSTQSKDTYRTVKNALEDSKAPYSGRTYEVFLQGSYGNDTNIYAESDVDVVIRLEDRWQFDRGDLSEDQARALDAAYPDVDYNLNDFKKDVRQALVNSFGSDVGTGSKAIPIAARGNRRSADVIAAFTFRRYFEFRGINAQSYATGICFYNSAGQRIANFPKQHSDNCTKKHKETNEWFKPMVRIFKNLRGKLEDERLIARGSAPSYFLEGLLYNVPKENFGISYADSFRNIINWIHSADRSKFLCANERYFLLWEDSPVTWRAAQCDAFVAGAIKLWNEW